MQRLRNQLIAKEGILPYQNTKELKRWTDLSKFIGHLVPVDIEHDGTTIVGEAQIVKCDIGQNLLCADFNLQDGVRIRKGFSLEFVYEPINQSGKFNGQDYDLIQSIKDIRRITLTDYPRDPNALASKADSLSNSSYLIGSDYNLINMEKKSMEKEEKAVFDSEIERLKTQLKDLNTKNDSLKKSLLEREQKEIDSYLSELKEVLEIDAKEFEGSSSDYIRGAYYALQKAKGKNIVADSGSTIKVLNNDAKLDEMKDSINIFHMENGKLKFGGL